MSDTLATDRKAGRATTSVQAVAILFIRLWAIQQAVSAAFAIQIQRHVYQSHPATDAGERLWAILGMAYQILFLVLAVVFFVFAGPAVRFFLRYPPRIEESYRFSIDDMVRAGAFLIGLYMLATGGPKAIFALMKGIMEAFSRDVPAYMVQPGGYIEYVAHGLLLIFALWLIVFPGHVTRLFSWLRKAGESAPDGGRESPGAH